MDTVKNFDPRLMVVGPSLQSSVSFIKLMAVNQFDALADAQTGLAPNSDRRAEEDAVLADA